MRKATIAAILLLGLAACSQASDVEAPVAQTPIIEIKTEAQFRSLIVGKTLVDGASSLVFDPGGGLSGLANNSPYGGSWRWEGRLLCLRLGTEDECNTVTLRGSSVTLAGEAGLQNAPTYTVLD